MAQKYKVGDRVRIKSIDWYNKNKDSNDNVVVLSKVPHFSWRENVRTVFTKDMVKFCGKVVTIESVWTVNYSIVEGTDRDYFTDEMIEGLVEEETKSKPKFKIGDRIIVRGTSGIWEITNVEDDILYTIKRENHTATLTTYGSFLTLYEELTDRAFKDGYEKCKSDIELNGFQIPEDYIVKNENGKVINATKIVLEKKKIKYPKTYEECLSILGIYNGLPDVEIYNAKPSECELFESLIRLKRCRDAYWKIAGEETGLGKPWEPDWREERYIIYWNQDHIIGGYREAGCVEHHTFEFPTPEIRDAFKENFDFDIEICKEFL